MTDRDENGRFIKGSIPNPNGRPKKATEQEYSDVLFSVIPLERWRKMIEAQAKRAEKGDILAFNALANRILPVIDKKEHAGKDGEAIKIMIVDQTNGNND